MRQIPVGVVDVEVFRKHAVLDVGEFPPGEHPAGVHGIPRLRFDGRPVRRDGGDDHAVSGLEVPDKASGFHDLADGLMAEDHIAAHADGALPDGVDIRGTRRNGDRTQQRVVWTADRDLFLDPAGAADAKHGVALHFHSGSSFRFTFSMSRAEARYAGRCIKILDRARGLCYNAGNR